MLTCCGLFQLSLFYLPLSMLLSTRSAASTFAPAPPAAAAGHNTHRHGELISMLALIFHHMALCMILSYASLARAGWE